MQVKRHTRRTSHGRTIVRAHLKRDKMKKCGCKGMCKCQHKRKHRMGLYGPTPRAPIRDANWYVNERNKVENILKKHPGLDNGTPPNDAASDAKLYKKYSELPKSERLLWKLNASKRKHKRLNWHTIGEYKGTPIMSPYKDAEPSFGTHKRGLIHKRKQKGRWPNIRI